MSGHAVGSAKRELLLRADTYQWRAARRRSMPSGELGMRLRGRELGLGASPAKRGIWRMAWRQRWPRHLGHPGVMMPIETACLSYHRQMVYCQTSEILSRTIVPCADSPVTLGLTGYVVGEGYIGYLRSNMVVIKMKRGKRGSRDAYHSTLFTGRGGSKYKYATTDMAESTALG